MKASQPPSRSPWGQKFQGSESPEPGGAPTDQTSGPVDPEGRFLGPGSIFRGSGSPDNPGPQVSVEVPALIKKTQDFPEMGFAVHKISIDDLLKISRIRSGPYVAPFTEEFRFQLVDLWDRTMNRATSHIHPDLLRSATLQINVLIRDREGNPISASVDQHTVRKGDCVP